MLIRPKKLLSASHLMSSLRPPPQKSVFVQKSPYELKFIGYVGGIM